MKEKDSSVPGKLLHRVQGCVKFILTQEIADEIRREWRRNPVKGYPVVLADKYGVHPKTIRAVLKRRTWCD